MLIQNEQGLDTIFPPSSSYNRSSSWEYIYDKFAPMMYGTIVKISGDRELSEAIFAEAFIDLKKNNMFSRIHHSSLYQCLLLYTYKTTVKYLEARGLRPILFDEYYPFINMFYLEGLSLKEAAIKLELTEDEVLKRLRVERNQFLSKNR